MSDFQGSADMQDGHRKTLQLPDIEDKAVKEEQELTYPQQPEENQLMELESQLDQQGQLDQQSSAGLQLPDNEKSEQQLKLDTISQHNVGQDTQDLQEEENAQKQDEQEHNDQQPPAASQLDAQEEESNPILAEFMSACQEGHLDRVKELISSGQVQASDTFSLRVTGLHWAAINNRLSVVKYLVENDHSKADPNARGGNLDATPLHWACRNGLVYVVDYLLSSTDADPTLKDSQNYNALHLAVHSSNITLVVYVILVCVFNRPKKIYIDEPDSIQCTPLHWAAYQGDILSVNALLRYGADVNKCDKSQMTPLHWAFIRGYKSVLAALLDAGADIHVKNDKGKDSFGVARDMNCESTWLQVLREADRDPKNNWEPRKHVISAKTGKLVTFFTPYYVLPVALNLCSFSSGGAPAKFVSVTVFVIISGIALLKLVVPMYMPQERLMFKTPIMAGLFSATAFWCVAAWLFSILPMVWKSQFLSSVVLLLSIAVFSYCFFKAMFINPGYVPIPSDSSAVLEQVKDLLRIGKFDTENFCVNTFIRKPLRSKFSKVSNRLIARFDHYCPWVYNDIGVRNHKLFVTYVYSLVLAIILFSLLAMKYFEKYAELLGYESEDEGSSCGILSDELCMGYKHNHFVFALLMWALFQLIWLGFLAIVQTFQIMKGLTTWEFNSINNTISNPTLNHSTVPRDFDGPIPTAGVTNGGRHNHRNGFSTLLKLFGLDQFIIAIKMAILSLFNRTTHSQNYTTLDNLDIPTDFGVKQNWLDFWFIGEIKWRNLFFLPIEGENNLNGKVVDYYKLYEYPPKVAGVDSV